MYLKKYIYGNTFAYSTCMCIPKGPPEDGNSGSNDLRLGMDTIAIDSHSRKAHTKLCSFDPRPSACHYAYLACYLLIGYSLCVFSVCEVCACKNMRFIAL